MSDSIPQNIQKSSQTNGALPESLSAQNGKKERRSPRFFCRIPPNKFNPFPRVTITIKPKSWDSLPPEHFDGVFHGRDCDCDSCKRKYSQKGENS